MSGTYWVETLGCAKNQVDSDKLTGAMLADGMTPAASPDEADLVIVNTCAFVEDARQESIDTILQFDGLRSDGSELVVTGCMAARYGDQLADLLPEVDRVVGFGGDITSRPIPDGVPVTIGPKPAGGSPAVPTMDLLNMARASTSLPWAYVKVAEGCDKRCGFCAIPSFRGPQRSRPLDAILEEVAKLDVREAVLIAQDLGAYGRDQGVGEKSIVPLYERVSELVDWVRLLYLYPSELSERLVQAIAAGPVPYFDLSLQHVSRPLLRRMRRWGNGERFLERIDRIRTERPDAAFRSNFIVGYPGETEEDHDALLRFVEQAQLDWCAFFAFSPEEGTHAVDLDGRVDRSLIGERLLELGELQDRITAHKRDEMIGSTVRVLVDAPGRARSHRESPDIDGIIRVDESLPVGEFCEATITGAVGPDLVAADAATPERDLTAG